MNNRIKINKYECIGCGLCIQLCPTLFELIDKIAVVRSGANIDCPNLLKAIEGCPTKAIKIWNYERTLKRQRAYHRSRISRITKKMTEKDFERYLQEYNEILKIDPTAVYNPVFRYISFYLIFHNPICKCGNKTNLTHHTTYEYPIQKENLIPLCYQCHTKIQERNKKHHGTGRNKMKNELMEVMA